MFRTKYTLREVARILRRSERSLLRDIQAGLFHATRRSSAHRRGRQAFYEVSMKQLERYLGEERAHRLFDPDVRRRKAAIEVDYADRNLKECRLCGHYKAVTEFTRDYRYADGLFPYCRDCERRIYGR